MLYAKFQDREAILPLERIGQFSTPSYKIYVGRDFS